METKEITAKNKICSTCKSSLPRSSFYKQKGKKDGLRYACKGCVNSSIKRYRGTKAHKDKLKEYYNTPEYKDRIKKRNDTQEYKHYLSEYRKTEKFKEYDANYKKENWEKTKSHRMHRYHNDMQYRLSQLLRSRTKQIIRQKQKAGSSVRDLGCSLSYLILHLEKQFVKGMSWSNTDKWHIDHIMPLASFNLEDRSEYLQAVHFTNLQPLWARENQSKGSKLYV